jgi:hypothetical protein
VQLFSRLKTYLQYSWGYVVVRIEGDWPVRDIMFFLRMQGGASAKLYLRSDMIAKAVCAVLLADVSA